MDAKKKVLYVPPDFVRPSAKDSCGSGGGATVGCGHGNTAASRCNAGGTAASTCTSGGNK